MLGFSGRSPDAMDDPLESAGGRAFRAFLFTTGCVGFLAAIYFASGPEFERTPIAVLSGFAISIAAIASPWLLRAPRKAAVVRPVLILIMATLLFLMAIDAGNFLSAGVQLLPAIVMTNTLVFGWRIGLLSVGGAAGTYGAVYLRWADAAPSEIGALYASFDYREVAVIASVGALILWSGAAAYQREMRRAAAALKDARSRAEDAARAKSAFLANVSHEIRTPMNGVLGMAEVLCRSDLPDREAKFADALHRAGENLLTILNDILDFSKIEANGVTLEQCPFDPRILVEDAAAVMRASAENKGLVLDVSIDADVAKNLVGDRGRLHQVLANLIGNAVKFTQTGGVSVTLTPPECGESGLRVMVADTGVGIPEDRLGSIFDEFVQAEASTARRFGGTGLGLSISRRLIEAMGGTIGVASEVGLGSKFWFEVALPEANERADAADEPTEGAGDICGRRGRPVCILVADDNDVNRLVVTNLLGRDAATIVCVSDGGEAVDAFMTADRPFDIILMDVSMPVVDGVAATKRIREIERSRSRLRTPIVALTAHADPGDLARFIAAGMDDHLTKPVSKAMLDAAIDRWARLSAPDSDPMAV